MNKKAVVLVEKFAEWFVPLMGLELAPSKGIRATFDIKTILGEEVGELEFCSLRRDDNKISLDMECWRSIFDKYLEYKEVNGNVSSIMNGDKKHCGMQIIIELCVNESYADGIYFMESK